MRSGGLGMALTKYKLGELLERNNECNENLTYGVADVRGVLNTKGIAGTKVSVDDRDLRKFLVVRPGGFIFNHRVHDKLGLGYNTSNDVYIFTNDYVSFYVKPEVNGTILLPDYLYMWYLRPEFDRYMLYKTYGSATLFFMAKLQNYNGR
jgi:type I restriction enzyme S subunit